MRKPLEKSLRSQLEHTVITARETAETAAREAFEQLGVKEAKAPDWLTPEQTSLRRALRARARALGGELLKDGTQKIAALVEEVAYEQWNRMVFARFLAENGLLTYEGVCVSIGDCAAIANELNRSSAWDVAADCAAKMLPNVFRNESLSFKIAFAPDKIKALEALIEGLNPATFQASDALGWIYQYWQTKKKAEVNASEVKIGADELAPVTQLFTEPYMVAFLLDNTLGAWYAAPKLKGKSFATETEARAAVATPELPLAYLRLVSVDGTTATAVTNGTDDGKAVAPRPPCEWKPASGSYEKWPASLADFSMLDPSCGSGHFAVATLLMLVPMRMELEGLDATTAVDRVLSENIHALELDRRCVEIAVFAVALEAWRYPGTKGYRKLPPLHIACDGIAPKTSRDEWIRLARRAARKETGDEDKLFVEAGKESLWEANLVRSMGELWDCFQQAPILGSLISPDLFKTDLLHADYGTLAEVLAENLDKTTAEEQEASIAAQGIIQAMQLLGRNYTLVATNVPYLARGKQSLELQSFCADRYPISKGDLSTVFLERSLKFAEDDWGSVSVVLPQNWLFLTSYQGLRKQLLSTISFKMIARLGAGGFQTPMWDFNVQLLTLSKDRPLGCCFTGLDVSTQNEPVDKAWALQESDCKVVVQAKQLLNPDARITFEERDANCLLSAKVYSYKGISTGDDLKYVRSYWEFPETDKDHAYFQSTVPCSKYYGGLSLTCWMDKMTHPIQHGVYLRAKEAWGRFGVMISQTGQLCASIYSGTPFDTNAGPLVPFDGITDVNCALWCYCSSPEYNIEVRKLDQALKVTNATLAKVPFDLEHWQKVAAEKYPNGLPAPFTDDPTQWIFHGHPCGSVVWDETAKKLAIGPDRVDAMVLQVAVARLMGYRWPSELDEKMELADEMRQVMARNAALEQFVDDDGIVCIPALNGEESAAARLTALLAAAYGEKWSAQTLERLLESVGAGGKTLEEWLRKDFFLQHAKLFGSRPFVWQIWDGLRDGFSVLVNYHKLDRKNLETLIYSYLGDWITRQSQDVAAGVAGADEKLDYAKELKAKLEKIVEGEAPYDIFVRWKSLAEQPVGWNPDLNDGVRLNIRPFFEAGILREKALKLNIKWAKDRGKDVESAPWFKTFNGERINDHHTTLAEKAAARARN